MAIYEFGQQKRKKDLTDKFYDSDWTLDEFPVNEIPLIWQSLSKSEVKKKLFKNSQQRYKYKEGFETYAKRVKEFIEISVQPSLEEKTFNLALIEILSDQLVSFGFSN